jgi:hypothetical protein
MQELKPWWTSKAIWTGIIGSLWGVAGTIGILPADSEASRPLIPK